MNKIEDVIAKLEQLHVVSFYLPHAGWAGYSPANGRYWVLGEDFPRAKEAALRMKSFGLHRWIEVDQTIDDDDPDTASRVYQKADRTRQIFEYTAGNGFDTGHIELYLFECDPEEHTKTLLALIDEGATILLADANSIRARIEPSSQEKLKELLAAGWTFPSQEEMA